MLAVTETAATAIGGILASRDLPEGAGVRLTRDLGGPDGAGEDPGIRLDLVTAPEEGDEVVEDAQVFLEPEAARLLEDKTLDAEVAGDEVRFAVREQGTD
jgi:Fe-S cluster assembly iron-binding protein IscA